MRCTAQTLEYYRYALGGFLKYLETRNINRPEEIKATDIRAFLVSLQDRKMADTTIHLHARATKTFCRWLLAEDHTTVNPFERVTMPRLDKKTLAALPAEDVQIFDRQ